MKRKQRSRKIKALPVARAAGVGALAGLLVMVIADMILSHLSGIGGADDAGYPEKIGYAYSGLQKIGSSLWENLSSNSGSLMVVGAGLVIGAVVGGLIYMVRTGAIRLTKHTSSRGRKSSRRRRTTGNESSDSPR
ncbi:MAG: hypothetical protein R6V19_16260 [Armatimonadota bacterium]